MALNDDQKAWMQKTRGGGVGASPEDAPPESSGPMTAEAPASSAPAASATVASTPAVSEAPASSAPPENSTPAVSEAPASSAPPENSTPAVSEAPASSAPPENSTPAVSEAPASSAPPENSTPAVSEAPASSAPPENSTPVTSEAPGSSAPPESSTPGTSEAPASSTPPENSAPVTSSAPASSVPPASSTPAASVLPVSGLPPTSSPPADSVPPDPSVPIPLIPDLPQPGDRKGDVDRTAPVKAKGAPPAKKPDPPEKSDGTADNKKRPKGPGWRSVNAIVTLTNFDGAPLSNYEVIAQFKAPGAEVIDAGGPMTGGTLTFSGLWLQPSGAVRIAAISKGGASIAPEGNISYTLPTSGPLKINGVQQKKEVTVTAKTSEEAGEKAGVEGSVGIDYKIVKVEGKVTGETENKKGSELTFSYVVTSGKDSFVLTIG